MSQLEVNQISVKYAKQLAVDQVSFQLQRGEIACLLGPSGCGKTSILRAIAGFELISTGNIILGQRTIADQSKQLTPQQREVGMVFQDFALYPHLTVWHNVAFGIASLDKHLQAHRVAELLALVGLEHLRDRYPHQLSGGQQQRVALIRAMAPQPALLLLDEPFSNLDVTLRQSLANELRLLLKTSGMTAILVSHDQNEAYAMADGIGVMHEGRMVQWGSADDLYQKPQSEFVASFIGQGAFVNAEIKGGAQVHTALGATKVANTIIDSQYKLKAHIRPEDVEISQNGRYKASVVKVLHLGANKLYTLALQDNEQIMVLSPNHNQHYVGQTVGVNLLAQQLNVFEV